MSEKSVSLAERGAAAGAPRGLGAGRVAATGDRPALTMAQAIEAGITGGEKTKRIGGRVSPELLAAAKDRSGLESDSALLEYALTKVALEDDFGPRLLARKGSVPDDVDL